jgi:ATP/maltotriose-dependent transcriptional regulator MalT
MSTVWPCTCCKCSTEYDIVVDNHLSLCTACQKLYTDCATCGNNYARIIKGGPAVCDECKRSHYVHCKLCTRHFPPNNNNNNNGIHCTACCNKEAEKCNDLFASRNMPPSAKAADLLNKARAQQQQQQQAAQESGLSVAAAARAMLTYNRSGYPGLGGFGGV